ncbi:DUF226 domain-containing protein [Borrelia persica]|uniref:DUF226 domain-containing protein n=1 Tax=Borrelia persica TaxID=44448 RepID=UPI0004635979|nr:DUF226 domain-containing protein [Borrelia persica]
MESVLERLKEKKDKPIFIEIENINGRRIYHTKIMLDFYGFGINKNQKHKFFISFRGLFDREKVEFFSLFSLRDDDKFLGIFYGFRKPIKNVVRRYEENGIMKASTFSKIYYIEFRFKKGSVCCYIAGISYLLKKEKLNKKYCKSLIAILLNIENEVYKFYDKELPNGGLITKWIEKNQK